MNIQEAHKILKSYCGPDGKIDEALVSAAPFLERNSLIYHMSKIGHMFLKALINDETNLNLIIDRGYLYEMTSSKNNLVYMATYNNTVQYGDQALEIRKSDIIYTATPLEDHIAVVVKGGMVKEILRPESLRHVKLTVYDLDGDSLPGYKEACGKIAKLKSENYIVNENYDENRRTKGTDQA